MTKTIALAYRINDLFEGTVPEFAKRLEQDGYDVLHLPYSRETTPQQIRQDIESRASTLEGRLAVTDGTVGLELVNAKTKVRALGTGGSEVCFERVEPRDAAHALSYLDGLFTRAATKYCGLPNPTNSDLHVDRARFVQDLAGLTREIAGRNGAPDKVYVMTDKLADHGPFNKPYGSNDDRTNAAQIVKQGLEEGGVPSDRIAIVEEWQRRSVKLTPGEQTWFVADRHSRESKYDDSPTFKCLPLPLSSLRYKAMTKGLIESGQPPAEGIYSMLKADIAK